MLSAPFYDIQTADVPNMRFRDFGGGRRGIEIDGNGGDPAGFTQRVALPLGETRSIRTSVLVQSDLVFSANGYEGIGVDVKCLVRNGFSEVPLVTWTNAPFLSGDPSNENLFLEQYPEFTLVTAVVQIPFDIPVEFVDVTWAAKGTSGQARFISASLRNHYQYRHKTSVAGATWQLFDNQLITLASGHQLRIDIRYIDAHATKIPQYSEVSIEFEALISSAVFYVNTGTSGVSGVKSRLNLMAGLKMRKKSLEYDYFGFTISDGTVEELIDHPVNLKPTFIARNAYTQIEPIIFAILPAGVTNADIGSRVVEHTGIEFNTYVNDSVSSGAA